MASENKNRPSTISLTVGPLYVDPLPPLALKFTIPPPPAQGPDTVFANALGDFVAAWAKKNPQQALNIVLLVGAVALALSFLAAISEARA